MPDKVPPPARDERWAGDEITPTSPPVGGWDRDWLVTEAQSILGCSQSDAEAFLTEYGPARARTLLDSHLTGGGGDGRRQA